jgi:hypothetical protein
MKNNLLQLIAEIRESTERFELEKIHLQHEIYKTIFQYNLDKLRTIDVNDITDKYEMMMLHHHPFIEILKKGDEDEFIEWLNSGDELGDQKERIYREILLPEIVKYERYSWVKHLKL